MVLADWDGLLAGPWLSCPLDHQRNATRAPISRAFRILPSVFCRPYVSRRYAPAAKLNEGSPQSNDQSDYSFLYRNGACRSELGAINSVIGAISDALIRRIPKPANSVSAFSRQSPCAVRGEREMDDAEAVVVRRIFREFARGYSSVIAAERRALSRVARVRVSRRGGLAVPWGWSGQGFRAGRRRGRLAPRREGLRDGR